MVEKTYMVTQYSHAILYVVFCESLMLWSLAKWFKSLWL